jgi:autotransporter-associated beta strand protein
MTPQPGFAEFHGTPGTVTVDASAGDISVTGMHFAVDGYVMTGAPVELTGSEPIVGVGDGSNASVGYTAVIENVLTGSTGLEKNGAGTLVLTGNNTYSAGTAINGGTLQLGNGGASGSIVGDVTNNGVFAFDRSDALTFAGVVSGTGSLTQTGAGTLTLTGTHTYSGGTTINGGSTLALTDAGSIAGSSGVVAKGTFDISGLTSGSTIQSLSGTGAVTLGAQTLTLSNASGQFGGVISGSGALTISGGT